MESEISNKIAWDDVIKKEARGSDDYSLGEVRQVTSEYIITHKGIVNTKWFQIPKRLAQGFDGSTLFVNVKEDEAKDLYKKEELPIESEDSETVVPLIEERLEPKKREVTEDATIIKEPSRETQQKEIELTHEELVLERKPVLEPTPTDESPVESRTEIKIPLKREDVVSIC
jgi:stress response protein YsnF